MMIAWTTSTLVVGADPIVFINLGALTKPKIYFLTDIDK